MDLIGGVGVDIGDVRPLELKELPPQAEVNARRLDLDVGIRKRLDRQVPGFEPPEDIAVREDHTGARERGNLDGWVWPDTE